MYTDESGRTLPDFVWQKDIEAAREALGASISLLLRLIGRDPDLVRSRDHVVLSVLAERRLRDGEAGVRELLEEIRNPSLTEIGAMSLDEFLPRRERTSLATSLNTAVTVSVADLDDDERMLVLGVVLEQFLAWCGCSRGRSSCGRSWRSMRCTGSCRRTLQTRRRAVRSCSWSSRAGLLGWETFVLWG